MQNLHKQPALKYHERWIVVYTEKIAADANNFECEYHRVVFLKKLLVSRGFDVGWRSEEIMVCGWMGERGSEQKTNREECQQTLACERLKRILTDSCSRHQQTCGWNLVEGITKWLKFHCIVIWWWRIIRVAKCILKHQSSAQEDPHQWWTHHIMIAQDMRKFSFWKLALSSELRFSTNKKVWAVVKFNWHNYQVTVRVLQRGKK